MGKISIEASAGVRELHDARAHAPNRLFTVHLLTERLLEEYVENARTFCTHYYPTQGNHSVLLVAPLDQFPRIASRLIGARWQRRAAGRSRLLRFFGRRLALPADEAYRLSPPALAWSAPRCGGTSFLLQGVRIEVPATYAGLKARCDKRDWTVEYALYSGAFFVAQLLWMPLHGRSDWYVKMDTDIVFSKRMPYDLGLRLARRPQVAIAHTGLNNATQCERGVLQAVRRFRQSHVASVGGPGDFGGGVPRMSPWCEHDDSIPTIFYGNFVAYRTSFMRSPGVLALSRHLFYREGHGYFETRWGDQASPMAYVCHTLNDVKLGARLGTIADERILHLHGLRRDVFSHRRSKVMKKLLIKKGS